MDFKMLTNLLPPLRPVHSRKVRQLSIGTSSSEGDGPNNESEAKDGERSKTGLASWVRADVLRNVSFVHQS